jgi:hypothetical protein
MSLLLPVVLTLGSALAVEPDPQSKENLRARVILPTVPELHQDPAGVLAVLGVRGCLARLSYLAAKVRAGHPEPFVYEAQGIRGLDSWWYTKAEPWAPGISTVALALSRAGARSQGETSIDGKPCRVFFLECGVLLGRVDASEVLNPRLRNARPVVVSPGFDPETLLPVPPLFPGATWEIHFPKVWRNDMSALGSFVNLHFRCVHPSWDLGIPPVPWQSFYQDVDGTSVEDVRPWIEAHAKKHGMKVFPL